MDNFLKTLEPGGLKKLLLLTFFVFIFKFLVDNLLSYSDFLDSVYKENNTDLLFYFGLAIILNIIVPIVNIKNLKVFNISKILFFILLIFLTIISWVSPVFLFLPLVIFIALKAKKSIPLWKGLLTSFLIIVSILFTIISILPWAMGSDSFPNLPSNKHIIVLYWYFLGSLLLSFPALSIYSVLLGNAISSWYYSLFFITPTYIVLFFKLF